MAGPEQYEAIQQVSGLMSLLEGHGDVTMDRAGADRIPSAERFSRVLRQRRQQRGPAKVFSSADRPGRQAAPVRGGRALHRRGRGRRRAGVAGQGVAGPALAALDGRDPRPARWTARVRTGGTE